MNAEDVPTPDFVNLLKRLTIPQLVKMRHELTQTADYFFVYAIDYEFKRRATL